MTGAKQTIEQAIKTMSQKVIDECKRMKSICSGFNFVDELYEMIKQLKSEAKGLHSHSARQTAQDFIRSIQGISDQLSEKTSKREKTHHPQKLGEEGSDQDTSVKELFEPSPC